MNLKDIKNQDPILAVVIESIETKAILAELERAQLFLNSNYYWGRKEKLEKRYAQLQNILKKITLTEEDANVISEIAPDEQYLLSEVKPKVSPKNQQVIITNKTDLFAILADALSVK